MFDQSRQDLEAQSEPLSPGFARDSGRLRNRVPRYQKDLKALERNKKGELLEGLFWYQDFGPPSSTTSFSFAEDTTFGQSLINLGSALSEARKSSLASLQLCILSTSPVSADLYSWRRRLLATNLGRLKAIVSFPRYAAAIEIEEAWGSMSECTYRSIERPEQLYGVDQLSLPEFRKQFLCHTDSDCKCKRFKVAEITNHYDKRPLPRNDVKYGRKMPKEVDLFSTPKFTIDLPSKAVETDRTLADEALTSQCLRIFLRDTASFTFTWQRGAPMYHGGFDTFLWERYSKPPSSDYAEVFYQDDRASSQPRRVFMAVSTTPAWMRASPLLTSMKHLLGGSEDVSAFMQKLSSDQQDDFYTLLPLFLVFEQIIGDTTVFIQQASDEVMKMSFAGRSNPSIEKIQYLCHLKDCVTSAAFGLDHVHSVMRELLSIIPNRTSDSSSAELEFLEEKEKDLAYLIKCVADLTARVDDQCMLIKSHRELAQTRQMSTLTYIATIYVPLSFVTGLLGMQVTDPTLLFHHRSSGSSSSASTSTLSAAATSTNLAARQVASSTSLSATPSPTADILALLASQLVQESAIANSTAITATNPNSYVWGFGFFLGVAGVFFVGSLLLPLVGPNLLRIVVQRSYTIRNYYVFWPFVFAFYYASVYWMIPEIMRAALGCHGFGCTKEENDYYNGKADYFYIYDFKTSGDNAISTVTYVLSAVVMGAIGITQLALAVMYRKGALVTCTWIGFAVVVIIVYFIDYYDSVEEGWPYAISTGLSLSAILPLVYLLAVWTAPQLWDLRKRRSKTEGKVKTI